MRLLSAPKIHIKATNNGSLSTIGYILRAITCIKQGNNTKAEQYLRECILKIKYQTR